MPKHRRGHDADRENFKQKPGGKLALEKIIYKRDQIPDDDDRRGKKREIQKPLSGLDIFQLRRSPVHPPQKPGNPDIHRENYH